MKRGLLLIFCTLAPLCAKDNIKEEQLDKIINNPFLTKLDELNRNTYAVDKEMINNKGYNSTFELFSYIPFSGFSNNGNGPNIDLRGQGINANVSTQVLLNGIAINMLDSSHGTTPLQSIGIHDIESIEMLPGGGAVMQGNGTRGGVVSINTKRRYQSLYLTSGINYKYANGLSPQADAKIASPIAKDLYAQLSAQANIGSGYRDNDTKFTSNLAGSLTYDISKDQSLSFDISYYSGDEHTSPVLRFSDYPNITKDLRNTPGNGIIRIYQTRFSTGLEYLIKLSQNQKLKINTYYQNYNSLYKQNTQTLDYPYRGMTLQDANVVQDHAFFTDEKAGLKANYQLLHNKGHLILGYDFLYNKALRNLPLTINYNSAAMSYHHQIHTYVDAKKFSNAIYAIEKYNPNKLFSITTGMRYELANYSGYRRYDGNGILNFNGQMPPNRPRSIPIDQSHFYHPITRHNIAAELIPSFHFSWGNLYLKYEHGFRSPNPDNLANKPIGNNYQDNNLKSENYDTFEIGSKLFANDNFMFMATLFYTLTQDEIFTTGSPHSGFGFSAQNLGLTHRGGIELASEQSFFEDRLRFIESFTYIDARILKSSLTAYAPNDLIPYVSNYKATINIDCKLSKYFSLYTQNSFNGAQRDSAQNKIKAYNLTDIGIAFTTKHFSITGGIANLFNSFYYSFYNADNKDSIMGLAFLPAIGRSYFIQGRYQF